MDDTKVDGDDVVVEGADPVVPAEEAEDDAAPMEVEAGHAASADEADVLKDGNEAVA